MTGNIVSWMFEQPRMISDYGRLYHVKILEEPGFLRWYSDRLVIRLRGSGRINDFVQSLIHECDDRMITLTIRETDTGDVSRNDYGDERIYRGKFSGIQHIAIGEGNRAICTDIRFSAERVSSCEESKW